MFKVILKFLVKLILKRLYRVDVTGLKHYEQAKQSEQPLLLIANHVSLLDGPLLDLFLPGDTTFMVDSRRTKKWYEKLAARMSHFIEVDIDSPYAAKHMIEQLKQGKQCMIFPEGRITTTGGLMKVYQGTGLVADKANAVVLPIFIGGAVRSRLSYLDGSRYSYLKREWFPKVSLNIQPYTTLKAPVGLKGPAKHQFYKHSVFKLLRDASYYGSVKEQSLFAHLLLSQNTFDDKQTCIEDINQQSLHLNKLVKASVILGRTLNKHLHAQSHARVGLMLPNVTGMPATFFALQAYGYTPAMINFTAGLAAIESACQTAQLETLVTSKKFVEKFAIEDLIEALSASVNILYLEDIRTEIGLWQKLAGLLTPKSTLLGVHKSPQDEAVVLFTSGSEGVPKGVVLSHSNIINNVEQINAMLSILPNEKIFNALPTFHCFGLTAGLLWPLFKGAKTFMYPSPVHYSVVPEMVYQTNASLIFGTDTFYTGYARKADPYDFYSLRALVAGAERLRPETRELYAQQFHQPIFEGYGVTETTPVIAVNTPLAYKHGSVGQFVPGMQHRLEPVPGIHAGGRLFVKGANVMLGYLMPDNPGVLQPPTDGWHDTGDIVEVDQEGYIWIKGRAKRFAKIGGEMVSLTAVETYINQASPEGHHVVVAVPDERKGEKLILVTDDDSLSRNTIKEAARAKRVNDLMIPKMVILVESIPVLGTGKTNYPEVQKLAESHLNH